jgi:outer membrane protein assembly factor BamA
MRQIRGAGKLSPGSVVTRRTVKLAKRRIRRYLRGRGFMDPKVKVGFDSNDGVVRVEAVFDRCYIIRIRVRDDPAPNLDGFAAANAHDFEDVLSFKDSGAFDLKEAEVSRRKLESWYQVQGYLFADVRVEHRTAHGKTLRAPGVQGIISFYVTRKYVNEIRNIRFKGNTRLSHEELLKEMSTQSYDFFGTGGYLLVDQLFDDLERVRAKYVALGYFEMSFPFAKKKDSRRAYVQLEKTADGEDELFNYTYLDLHFRMRKHPEESVIYLEVPIREGQLSRMGEIGLKGTDNSVLAKLRTRLKMQPGSPFSSKFVRADITFMERFFQKLGYHQVKIETSCNVVGAPPDSECDWRRVRTATVNLKHQITMGDQFVVGEIFVRGNFITHPTMLTVDLPKPGEALNRVKLDRAEKRLRNLGVFSGVQIQTVGLDVTPPRREVALVVVVEERPAQFLELSGGFESLAIREGDEGLPHEVSSSLVSSVGVMDSALRAPRTAQPINIPDLLMFTEIQYRHRNFLGRAMELQFPIKYGFSTPVNNSALHRLGHISLTLYDPFLMGSDYALETTLFGRYDRASKEEDEYEFGGQIAISKTFFKRLRTRLQFTASGIQSGDFTADVGPDGSLPFTPLRPKMELQFKTTLDFLDNPANPTRGFSVSSDFSYINIQQFEGSQQAEDEVFGNFLKWEAVLKVFLNFRRKLILALFARYADSLSIDENSLPEVERYRLGGIWGVRGFEDDTIGPMDENGDPVFRTLAGGDTLFSATAELRFPILARLNLWGGLFFDVGALDESLDALHPRSFRTAAGVGIRYLVFGQVPIRLDVGFNLDRRCIEAPDLSTGQCKAVEPLTVPQFGLLYSF